MTAKQLTGQFNTIQKMISYLFTIPGKKDRKTIDKLNDLLTIQSFLLNKSINLNKKRK